MYPGQTRMGFGRVTLPSKGPTRGQYVFVIGFLFTMSVSGDYLLEMIMLVSLGGTLYAGLTKNGVL